MFCCTAHKYKCNSHNSIGIKQFIKTQGKEKKGRLSLFMFSNLNNLKISNKKERILSCSVHRISFHTSGLFD